MTLPLSAPSPKPLGGPGKQKCFHSLRSTLPGAGAQQGLVRLCCPGPPRPRQEGGSRGEGVVAGAWHADLMGSSVQSTSALPSAVRALSLCGGAGEPAFPPPLPGPLHSSSTCWAWVSSASRTPRQVSGGEAVLRLSHLLEENGGKVAPSSASSTTGHT